MKHSVKRVAAIHDLSGFGRGLDYGIACEACLKLKEISYVNAEAYCAGELKHGTISLITEGSKVLLDYDSRLPHLALRECDMGI